MDNYSFGKCSICHKDKALKNGVCIECQEGTNIPDFMKDLFGGFGEAKE